MYLEFASPGQTFPDPYTSTVFLTTPVLFQVQPLQVIELVVNKRQLLITSQPAVTKKSVLT